MESLTAHYKASAKVWRGLREEEAAAIANPHLRDDAAFRERVQGCIREATNVRRFLALLYDIHEEIEYQELATNYSDLIDRLRDLIA
jgi:hypothetical protein